MNFEPLTPLEISTVLHRIPAPLQAQLQRENIVLAGGAIRDTVAGLPVKDVDIFCHSEEQAQRLATEVSACVKHTKFAYSVNWGIPVQYVFYKDFASPEDLISQFDFRACCAGIYWEGSPDGMWDGVAVEGFHEDCAAHVLRFMSQPKDNGKLTAMRRALDFSAKGWKLPTEEAVRIVTHWEPTLEPERVRHAFRPGYGGRR